MNHESPCISINHKLSHFENTLVLSKTKEEKKRTIRNDEKEIYSRMHLATNHKLSKIFTFQKKKKNRTTHTTTCIHTNRTHNKSKKIVTAATSRIEDNHFIKTRKKKKTKWKEKVVAHCERKMQRHKKLIIATWRTTDSASFIGGSAYLPGVTEIRLVSC